MSLTHIHIHTHSHTHSDTHTHAHTGIRTHTHARACTHSHTHRVTHTHTHTHTHARTHTHAHPSPPFCLTASRFAPGPPPPPSLLPQVPTPASHRPPLPPPHFCLTASSFVLLHAKSSTSTWLVTPKLTCCTHTLPVHHTLYTTSMRSRFCRGWGRGVCGGGSRCGLLAGEGRRGGGRKGGRARPSRPAAVLHTPQLGFLIVWHLWI